MGRANIPLYDMHTKQDKSDWFSLGNHILLLYAYINMHIDIYMYIIVYDT